MDVLREHQQKRVKYIISASIWLVTSILSAVVFISGRRVIISVYSRFFLRNVEEAARNPLSFLNILVSFPLAFLVIAIIIGGFEYHLGKSDRVGSEKSYWLFARTLAVEVGFLLLALYI